jgi:Domain of unknown function (DUF4402)
MKNILPIIGNKKAVAISVFSLLLSLLSMRVTAQEEPPRPLQVTVFQNLSFGGVIQGNTGGEIIISPEGSRTVTGDLIPINMGFSYYPAIFEVEAMPGTLISIVNGPDVSLAGNHGGAVTLHLSNSIPNSPFVNALTPPFRTQVRIGGTLYVGNSLANPAGDYFGYFSVTFVQQ